MKLKYFAKLALEKIENNTITFINDNNKRNCIVLLKTIILENNKNSEFNNDTVIELCIKVKIPNFDYPIIEVDENNDPIVWEETDTFLVDPNNISHDVILKSINEEEYNISNLSNLSKFSDIIVKVDGYTTINRAIVSFLQHLCVFDIKDDILTKVDYKSLVYIWDVNCKDDPQFESSQHAHYIHWLSKWISVHGKNPETHLKVLRLKNK